MIKSLRPLRSDAVACSDAEPRPESGHETVG